MDFPAIYDGLNGGVEKILGYIFTRCWGSIFFISPIKVVVGKKNL